MIIAKFGNENILCLLDTGSSISLMSREVFDKLKAQLKYKFLGRSVSISTINSQVKFTGCADVSFKINKQHYRHNLYLSRIAETSPFDAILGYDFISKYNVLIFSEMGCCKLKNEFIYFNEQSTNTNKKIRELFQNNLKLCKEIEENMNENILKNSELTKFINVPPFIPNREKQKIEDNKYKETIVTLS